MHVLSDANGLPLVVGVSAADAHDSEGLKPMVAGQQTTDDPYNGRHFKPQRFTPTRPMPVRTFENGYAASASASASPAKASTPANAIGAGDLGEVVGERAVADELVGQHAEPPFDLVDAGGADGVK